MWLFFNLVVHGQQCGLLAVCLSVFLFMLHFLHSVVSLHCILYLLEWLLKPSGLLCKL